MTREEDIRSIMNGVNSLNDSINLLNGDIAELKAWKERKEAIDAERITRIHNEIVNVLAQNKATVDETISILEMTKHEAITNFKPPK